MGGYTHDHTVVQPRIGCLKIFFFCYGCTASYWMPEFYFIFIVISVYLFYVNYVIISEMWAKI